MQEELFNHYEICCFLYAGDTEAAQKCLEEKTRGLDLTPALRNIYLSSLNFAIYNFILFQENVSLHECCMENAKSILNVTKDGMLAAGAEIIRSYAADSRRQIARYGNPDIRAALSYIHNHLGEDLTLQTVSSRIGMNRNYFCQLFRQEVGVSYAAYIRCQRMKLARLLLSCTDLSIQEIAEKSGFHTASYFSTCFRQTFCCRPSELRRRQALQK